MPCIFVSLRPGEGVGLTPPTVGITFGSRTVVNALIRCARLLRWAAAHCFKLPMSCYFDDFVSFLYPTLAKNTQSAVCLMLDILGWGFDREDPKSDDFSMVSAPGVQFDSNVTCGGVLQVCTAGKRMCETLELLDGVMAKGTKKKKREVLVLRGRPAFCDAFIFGRLGKLAWQDITKHAYANSFAGQLNTSTLDSMGLLGSRIADSNPRCLICELLETLHLFADASFDTDHHAGLGEVRVDGAGKVIAWFGLIFDLAQPALFLADGQQTIIGELETLAVALSLLIWQNLLGPVQLMVYFDN